MSATVCPIKPWGLVCENGAERSTTSVLASVADFAVALQAARTNREALRIYLLIHECVLALGAAEDAALNRADALCGQPERRS